MCQLLGLSFNHPVTADFSLRGLQKQVDGDPMYCNRNGWGIALFQENAALVIKEPLSADISPLFQHISALPLTSNTMVAHIRFSTKGVDSLRNTHPFSREVFGSDVVFAHNGTLGEGVLRLETGHYDPVGETDSEGAFLHLLHAAFTPQGVHIEALAQAVKTINELGEFNFLLAKEPYLYAYHCRSGYKGLYALQRMPPHLPARLADEDFVFDFSSSIYENEQGFIVASAPLTDELWQPFQPGEIQVFCHGRRVAQYRL
jgi:glutamine amidotransferase